MISLSTASLYFAAFMILGPLLLRNNSKYRKYIFLIMNLAVFLAAQTCIMQILVSVLWILIPYAVVKLKIKEGSFWHNKWRGLLIVFILAVFAYLMKYDVIFEILHIPYAFVWKILGLSYFLFREIDFIMQSDYLQEMNIETGLVDYLNFILCFYTLLAGPITRYEMFKEDFSREVVPLTYKEILTNLNRAANGYIKVYVISSVLAYYARFWFDGLTGHSNIFTTGAAYFVFALLNGWYIYFNFSGYCDIVVAFAALSGFTLQENFKQPYLARSVVEFWNRHHITLSEWIRDYIFSPFFKVLISGPCEKNVKLGQYISLFVTFTIAGIWHGTDLNYLAYGLLQGFGIVVASVWKDNRKKLLGKERNKLYEKNKLAIWAGRAVTWTYICLTFGFVGYDLMGVILS